MLVATLWRQIWKQWHADDAQAVSTWLFIGQMTVSVLFIAYSIPLHSWVFVVTNSLVLATANAGQCMTLMMRRRALS